jgi:hypothetical protein
MRARLQKLNILQPAKYEKDLTSIIIYDENDNPILVAANTVAGAYQFSYAGMPDFGKIFQEITGKKLADAHLVELNESKNGIL